MNPLTEKVAEVMYSADNSFVPWEHALADDRAFYQRVADVVVDTVIEHLRTAVDIPTAAIEEFLQAETDIARLRRGDTHVTH